MAVTLVCPPQIDLIECETLAHVGTHHAVAYQVGMPDLYSPRIAQSPSAVNPVLLTTAKEWLCRVA